MSDKNIDDEEECEKAAGPLGLNWGRAESWNTVRITS